MVKSSGDKTLDQVLLDIEKQFGKGAVMKLGSTERREIDVVSSGSISLLYEFTLIAIPITNEYESIYIHIIIIIIFDKLP